MDRQLTGFSPPNLRIQTSGILSAQQITASINSGAPILMGISPQGLPFPPGLAFSEHAVVIEGYCEPTRESPTATVGFACTLVERRKNEAEQMLS
jgi:hypothetical protein